MRRMLTVVLLGGLLAAAGCAQNGGVTKEGVGTAVGGALGGLLGAQVGSGTGRLAATAAGALAGAFLGNRVGRSMDQVDKTQTAQALESTPTGQSVAWKNPDTGDRYQVTPTHTYAQNGQPCRDFTTQAWIDGEQKTVHGTACRQPDGTWHTM